MATAAAVGGCVGLAIGSAYVAGALARASVEDAQARRVAGSVAALAAPRRASGPAAALPAPPSLARVDLRGPVAPPRDLECLSQAVYYEARGEAERGRQAVAQVVLNRVRRPHFPKSVCGVVFQHAQAACAFSFACDGQTRHRLEPAAWRDARRVAQRALAGFAVPEVAGATDFRGGGGGAPPGLARIAQIGRHVFYRGSGHLPPRAPVGTETPTPVLVKAETAVDAVRATPAA